MRSPDRTMITVFLPFLFAVGGCSDAVQPIDPTMPASLIVTPAKSEVGVDSSVAVNVVAVNSNGNPVTATLRWSVSDTTIAVVSDHGLVSGRSQGMVTVSASSGSVTGTTSITVRQANAAVPGPTAPTPPATGAGLSGFAFAYDDFSSYASTAELVGAIPGSPAPQVTSNPRYVEINNSDLLLLDRTVLYNGHPTLRYRQPESSDRSPSLYVPVSPNRDKVWIRGKIRWAPGFSTEGTGFNSEGNVSSPSYKIIDWAWSGVFVGRGGFDVTNGNQYQLSFDVRREGGTTVIGPFAYGVAGRAAAEWTDGLWYDYIVYFERLSDSQTRSRVWMARDGETPVLRATVDGPMIVGAVAPRVARVMLGLNFNQVRRAGQNQALWWGQWEIVDGSKYANPFGVR